MMMEIKADVHAVHPISENSGPNPPAPKYGSWCTSDGTTAHDLRSGSNSNAESTPKIKDGHLSNQQADLKSHNLRASPKLLPHLDSADEIQEAPIELDEIKKTQEITLQNKKCSPEKEKSLIPKLDAPQNPVPTSPLRQGDCRGPIQLPRFCDPFMPIDPQGKVYISWLLLVTFSYSYNAWCIALRATFPYQTPENTLYWMLADYACDVIYLLDVAFVKPRLMFLHEGFWVTDHAETRKNYRRKRQYKFDVISLTPLDLLYLVFGTEAVILRLPRLLKLQTFWEFHQAVDRVLSSPYAVRIGKMLFYVFYLIHLNACAYYAMSAYEGLGSNGWVYDNEGTAYIRCFYFATKTATSIGKNPKPENGLEYLFMTGAWLMGVFVFALLIGQIRDIFATSTRARAEYRKNLDGCTRYLRKLNMPERLQRRVTAWFEYNWKQHRCFNESKILNTLPYNMKRDVALAVHMTTLSKVQLFSDCSDSLLRDLVLQLRPVSFLPGDVVVRRGDVGHHMYIIKNGECCVMSQNESEVLARLGESAVFGEISLLGIAGLRRRTATVRSRGYSSLFALSRSDLDAALRHHPAAALLLRRRADLIVQENAARQAALRISVAQTRKSVSIGEEGSAARRRRRGSGSASSVDTARPPARGRLSVLSEDSTMPVRSSLRSTCRTPVPTIVLSAD